MRVNGFYTQELSQNRSMPLFPETILPNNEIHLLLAVLDIYANLSVLPNRFIQGIIYVKMSWIRHWEKRGVWITCCILPTKQNNLWFKCLTTFVLTEAEFICMKKPSFRLTTHFHGGLGKDLLTLHHFRVIWRRKKLNNPKHVSHAQRNNCSKGKSSLF